MYPYGLAEVVEVAAETIETMEVVRPNLLLSSLVTEVPGLIAAGLVNLDQGTWRALETTGRHPEDFLNYLAATTKAYFEGDAVKTIRSVLNENTDGEPQTREIEEIIIRSTNYLHLVQRMEGEPRTALGIVTTREPKLGLIRAAVNKVLKEIPYP